MTVAPPALVALALAALVGPPAGAAEDSAIAREAWKALGWNSACSVALEVLAYPKLGAGMQSDPMETRVGTLTVPPQKEDARLAWSLEADGKFTWDERAVAEAEGDLKAAGYSRPGFPEELRPEVGRPALAEVLLSTAALAARAASGWPGPEWRLSAADFNPLSTCALLVYARRSDGLRHRFLVVRVYAPRARWTRARAHAENSGLLYAAGDLDAAAAEAATAARLGPELAPERYQYAAMLALTGHDDEAIVELSAAIRLEPKYRVRAGEDADLENLRVREDFRQLVGGR